LIKPFWGSGGEGIVRIRNQKEFIQFKPPARFPETMLLIQPVIKGTDIDISLLAVNGIIKLFAIQKGKNKDTRLKYSWQIEFLEDPTLLQVTAEIISKLNYTGIAHLDYRLSQNKNEYTLVDFNARYWTTLTGALTAGLNFPVVAVYEGLGLDYEEMKARNGNYSKTNNVISMLVSRLSRDKNSWIRYHESELIYSIKDPLPYMLDFLLKSLNHPGIIRKRLANRN
jgi:predicted ATP-grasp superfamily ATP-dependent carboligase